ncbi:MAG: hypothetical protein WBL20_16720 [Sphingobium sp.]
MADEVPKPEIAELAAELLQIRGIEHVRGGPDGGPAVDELKHFARCHCGAWVDRRDLGAVLAHNAPHAAPPPIN